MDLWTYLRGLRRWWWMLVAVPAIAFLLAQTILIPQAKWQVTWTSAVVTNGDPNLANMSEYLDYVLLDDIGHLLQSDVLGDLVYADLPAEITERYSREDVGDMYSTFRHARFVEITVEADDPEVASVVAETTRLVLPEAINRYLVPPDFDRIPIQVSVTTLPGEPVQPTRDRMVKVGGVTLAGGILGVAGAGVAEWMRLDYRAKYRSR